MVARTARRAPPAHSHGLWSRHPNFSKYFAASAVRSERVPGRKIIERGCWAALPLACAALSVTSPSRAQGKIPDLRYEADATCPDQAAFSALLREKLTATGADAANATSPRIALSLRATSSGFVGQLDLQRADSSQYERAVNGVSCAEVANALAFVLALALGTKDPPAAPAEATPAQTPATPEAATLPAPAAPAAPPVLVASPRLPEPPGQRRRSPWRFGGGIQLGARAGLAPSWLLVESAFVEARRVTTSPFAFALRAGFENAASSTVRDNNGTTDFSWWAGELEGCPAQLRLLQRLALRPCAGLHVGRLRASGHPTAGVARVQSKLWGDALAGLRLELALLPWLSLDLHAPMLLPFTPYQFVFNPNAPVYQVPRIASAGFLGLAGHFP